MAIDLCVVSVFEVQRIPGEIAACEDKYHHSQDYSESFAADF
jgi:hypothetical protein